MAEKHLAKTRKFKSEDINQILEIEEQAFPKTVFSKATILTYADRLPDTFIVVQSGKAIVGYIIFDLTGHIHSTVVKKSYRRKGFGKMLFMYALRCAEKGLWLEVRSENSEAIEFYKRLGMKIIGKIPNYYEDDHALIMRLEKSIPP
ncbi:MAG: [ribosomal protein S18]-alanine N-acetyltransferase [Desulfobacteraceae bacterium Eth-SRB2]|nr:MAG: [ribosomal protein S18]-alanine N-acetyltransferase [Desulfobacteraceae bacterium Eth-SRB2]